MLQVILPAFDEFAEVLLDMEHSLVSISKWEAKYEKPFFDKAEKTEEEIRDYISAMVLNKEVTEDDLNRLSLADIANVFEYVNSKQTATWFNDRESRNTSREIITSELVYYWMIAFKIPFECQDWHFNRLMTLIKICGEKQTKPKRMSARDQAAQYRALNEQRRAQMGTTG